MFAILQISDTNTIFRKPKIYSQRITTPDGEAFFTVTAEKHLGRIPWKKLESCLGILKKHMILPEDISLPEHSAITEFSPDIFTRLLLMNSAVDYITKHKDEFIYKTLTIFDEKGIYENYIEKLLLCFANIKIITNRPENYNTLSHKLMDNYGLSLLVSSVKSYDSDVIISHHCSAPVYFSGTVFTNEKKPLINGKLFTGNGIILPTEYENLNTCKTESLLFASALYEKCGCSNLAHLKYNCLTPTTS